MIYISYAEISDALKTQELFERVCNSFPHPDNFDYLNEIMSRKSEQSRRESFFAMLILSSLLNKAGADSRRLILRRSLNGKPYFADHSLHFSLTHSNGYAAAALSDTSPVGLDLECAEIEHEKAKKLAMRWFGKDEADAFFCGREGFERIWTKKEAFAKMQDIPLSELISKGDTFNRELQKCRYSYFDVERYPLTLCCLSNEDDIFLFEAKL